MAQPLQQIIPRNMVEMNPTPKQLDSIQATPVDSTYIPMSLEATLPKKETITLPLFTHNVDSLLKENRVFTQSDSLVFLKDKPLGLDGKLINTPLSYSPGISAIILISLLLTTRAYSLGTRFYSKFFNNLFSHKDRISTLFETTLSGLSFKTFLGLQTILLEALLFYNFIRTFIYPNQTGQNYLQTLLVFILVLTLFHLIRSGILTLLGSVFSSKNQTQNFISEYFTLLSLWGTWLLPVTLMMTFYHLNIWLLLALILIPGLLFRILLLLKGVKIFFSNSNGFFYIILYLCALEIMPVIALYLVLVAAYSMF